MQSRRRRGEPSFEPGSDPHERKLKQLCEQVAETIALALADCGDPALHGVWVERVEPDPGAGRLRLIVGAEAGCSTPLTIRALERARGYLRRQIAEDIHRKRTPDLSFAVAAPSGPDPDPE